MSLLSHSYICAYEGGLKPNLSLVNVFIPNGSLILKITRFSKALQKYQNNLNYVLKQQPLIQANAALYCTV